MYALKLEIGPDIAEKANQRDFYWRTVHFCVFSRDLLMFHAIFLIAALAAGFPYVFRVLFARNFPISLSV